jgi:hypothetical protein
MDMPYFLEMGDIGPMQKGTLIRRYFPLPQKDNWKDFAGHPLMPRDDFACRVLG